MRQARGTGFVRYLASLGACLLALMVVVAVLTGLRGSARAGRPSPDVARLQVAPGDVVINEVAWMGTAADYRDEWIELYNNSQENIDLSGWSLSAADGTPDISLLRRHIGPWVFSFGAHR